jgi:histidinol-phosphatase
VTDERAELELALELADLADALTLPAYERRAFTVESKADRTEVTEVDRATEAALVDRLATARPAHAVYGEEGGRRGGEQEWCWIVDPIDGTSGFTRGIPVWATLLALSHAARGPVVGVVSAPALRRRWWAADGLGAFVDGQPCRVSTVDSLAAAQVSVTINDGWRRAGRAEALAQLSADARRGRGFGDFWQHVLVAEGALDVAVDAIGVAPYDLAAPKVIVEQAGGTFTDRFGTATHESDSAISSNGLLHAEVLARLAEPPSSV